MYSFLRSSPTINNSYKLLHGCHRCYHNLQCTKIRKSHLNLSTQLLSTSASFSIVSGNHKNHVESTFMYNTINFNVSNARYISLSSACLEKKALKPSSKVEVTVQELKKKQEETKEVAPKPIAKKSIMQKIKDELIHYYHGFRLLFIDIKISSYLVWRVLRGKSLTRREYQLLIRTVGDMFRLVPFSVFLIVPFMEFTLPIFLKFFPGMLPSTFQTQSDKEAKFKQNLKVKLEMAKFLQETLDNMAVQHKDHNSEQAKRFAEWFQKVRTSGEYVSNEDIMKFSKLFEDEITLDSLSRSQLIALCRVLEVQTLGINSFLRFQLRMKLRRLAADDRMIQKEGINSLTLAEVQQACRARGMRAYGLSEERLRKQLGQWLDLSLNEKVPPSLLLLSRALMLPETIPTSDKLKATISALPEEIVTQTKAAIGEKEGKIDNKVKIELLKEEERKVKEERQEQREEKKKQELIKQKADKEILIDKAPIIFADATPILEDTAARISAEKLDKVEKKDEQLQSKDLEIIESAVETMKDKKFVIEKEEIEELKEQMADYKEDVEDLQKAVAAQPKPEIKESKAAKRLYNTVNKMISRLDTVLDSLEKKEQKLRMDLEKSGSKQAKEELLKIDDIMDAINKIKVVPDQSRVDQITKVLQKMDDDQDGAIKVEDVLKVIEFIGKENVNLTSIQIDELIELLDKEEILEVENRIEKALLKDKEASSAADVKQVSPPPNVKNKSDSPEDKPPNGDGTPPKASGGTKAEKSTKSNTVLTPPPVNSIEKPKTQDSSKTF